MALTKVTNNLLELDAAQPSITSTGTLTNFTSTGIDDNATSNAITITSDEKVAIGSTVANKIFNLADPAQGGEALKLHFEANASADKWAIYAYDRTNGHYANMSFGANSLAIDNGGRVTMPSQPAFSVKPASLQTNIAINSQVTIAFGTEVFDVGANFASNTFTAPVTGKYQLNLMLRLESVDTAANFYQIRINTSNRNYVITFDLGGLSSDTPYWAECFSVLADMDASDTVSVQIYQSVGTVQTDINADSNFSGYLVA
jgi:hypothetical protein